VLGGAEGPAALEKVADARPDEFVGQLLLDLVENGVRLFELASQTQGPRDLGQELEPVGGVARLDGLGQQLTELLLGLLRLSVVPEPVEVLERLCLHRYRPQQE
jgi:hypothetical protein